MYIGKESIMKLGRFPSFSFVCSDPWSLKSIITLILGELKDVILGESTNLTVYEGIVFMSRGITARY